VLEVSKRFLVDVEQHIIRSDLEELKGIALHKEKYLLMQERMKLILHYFRHFVKLNLKVGPNANASSVDSSSEEFLKIRKQLICKGLSISDKRELDKMRNIADEALQNQDESDINKCK
jgi:hypothetical protein